MELASKYLAALKNYRYRWGNTNWAEDLYGKLKVENRWQKFEKYYNKIIVEEYFATLKLWIIKKE
jgi:hypothetical protein